MRSTYATALDNPIVSAYLKASDDFKVSSNFINLSNFIALVNTEANLMALINLMLGLIQWHLLI